MNIHRVTAKMWRINRLKRYILLLYCAAQRVVVCAVLQAKYNVMVMCCKMYKISYFDSKVNFFTQLAPCVLHRASLMSPIKNGTTMVWSWVWNLTSLLPRYWTRYIDKDIDSEKLRSRDIESKQKCAFVIEPSRMK